MRNRDFLLVTLAAALWGTGGVLGLELSRHAAIHPLSVAMWRMLVGGLSLVILQAVRGRLTFRFSTAAWRRILISAVLTAAFEALFFTALTLSSVGLTTLIGIGSAPVFVAISDKVFRRERPQKRTAAALTLALVGLALLMSGSLDVGEHGLWGAVLALANGAVFAAITIVNRVPVPGLAPVPMTAIVFSIGGLLLVPVAAIPGLGVATDVAGLALMLALGMMITAGGYVAFLTGLQTVPPFVATIVSLLEPVIAAVLGAIVLGERLGPAGIAGGAVLGATVVLLRPQRDKFGADPLTT